MEDLEGAKYRQTSVFGEMENTAGGDKRNKHCGELPQIFHVTFDFLYSSQWGCRTYIPLEITLDFSLWKATNRVTSRVDITYSS